MTVVTGYQVLALVKQQQNKLRGRLMEQGSKLQQKMGWFYLINLVFFFIPLFMVRFTAWQYASMALALLLFLYCYFLAYRSSNQRMYLPIAGIVLIATLITPVNPGSVSMFAYAAFFIGFAYPLRRYLLLISLLALWLVALKFTMTIHWAYFLPTGLPIIIGVSVLGRAERYRIQQASAKAQSDDEIKQLAMMVERERIGRDLHDILGHTLSSIILKADLAEKLLAHQQPDEARQQLTELSQIARDAMSQVRQSVSGYKHQGLMAEVSKLLQRLRDAGFSAELKGNMPRLAKHEETVLILILTELVTNVLRHSNGNSCLLSFNCNDAQLQIQLRDNGRVNQLHEGNGLHGIRERLAALGGILELDTIGHFRAVITLPLAENAA